MFAGLQTKLIIAGVVLAILGGVALYFRAVLDENATLKGNQRQLETALDLKDTEIGAMQDMATSRHARAEIAQKDLWAAQEKVNELEGLLERHDLAMLVKRKPGLVTRRMQSGTSRAFRNMEEAANESLE